MQSVVVDQVLEAGIRVTVAMGTDRNLDSGKESAPYFLSFFLIYC